MSNMNKRISKDIIIYIDGIKCRCNTINITVYESYNIPNDKIEQFVNRLRTELSVVDGIKFKRSKESFIREIYAHNVLYRRNICVMSSKDTDITDNEEWYRLLAFDTIYYIGQLKYKLKNIFKK